MRIKLLSFIAGTALGMGIAGTALAADGIRVISDRTPSHLEPLFEAFSKGTGLDVDAVFVDDGLLARVAARPTEADLVITSTAGILERAKADGLLQPYSSSAIDGSVDASFRDTDNAYVVISYRARAIYASKDRVEAGAVTRYEDLADPKWQGRVCIRSGYHRYNVSLFAQMAVDRGLDEVRTFLTGLSDNLARNPVGNDRNQVRGIMEGACDLAIANSYYYGIMLGRDDQRPWAEASKLIFPNQDGGGAYVLSGGMGLTTADGAVAEATQLMEFLVSEYGQTFMVNTTFEYPVIDGVELPEVYRQLGAEQPQVKDGRFRANVVPLKDSAAMVSEIVSILDELNFDKE